MGKICFVALFTPYLGPHPRALSLSDAARSPAHAPAQHAWWAWQCRLVPHGGHGSVDWYACASRHSAAEGRHS